MIRILLSFILFCSMAPLLSGCGEEKPMVEGEYDTSVEIDPAAEAELDKQAKQDMR